MTAKAHPGRDALRAKGWLAASKWLLLRRAAQFGFLGLFLLGPWAGIWIVEGTLISSDTLDVLPLSDPYALLQSLAAGQVPAPAALIGGAVVLAVYAVIGGRVYCSWVCPINVVTDAAHWLRGRLDLPKGWQPKRSTRFWVLAMTLAVSAATGVLAWELVNPITLLHRGLLFGLGFAWTVVAAVFLFDLLVSRQGWCGHLCPVGALLDKAGAGIAQHDAGERSQRHLQGAEGQPVRRISCVRAAGAGKRRQQQHGGQGDAVVKPAFHVQRLPDADRHRPVRDHGLAQRGVGRGQDRGQQRRLPDGECREQVDGDAGAGEHHQGQADDQHALRQIVIAPQQAEIDPRRVGEQHQDQAFCVRTGHRILARDRPPAGNRPAGSLAGIVAHGIGLATPAAPGRTARALCAPPFVR